MSLPPKSNRSGGPRTDQGKLTSSKNALKSGAYSKQEILPFESQQEFDELKHLFIQDFRPHGVTELSLVHELTVLAWKKQRFEKIENNFLYGLLQAVETPEEFYAAGFPRRDQIDWLLRDLFILTSQFISKHRMELELAKSIRKTEVLVEFLKTAEERYFEFYRRLKEAVRNPPSGEGEKIRVILVSFAGSKSDPDEDMTPMSVDKILSAVIQESEAVLYIAENLEKLMQLKDLIRDRRLKNFMETSGVGRPYQELSRSFFKVLAELRKQQEWRYQKGLIEVATEAPALPASKPHKK
jgi:hypothetical protein